MANSARSRAALAFAFTLAGVTFVCADTHAQPVAQGNDFVIGSSGPDYRRLQRTRAVSREADGSFVVVWRQNDGGLFGVFAQRYDSSGTPVGTEFRVSGEDDAMANLRSDLPAIAPTQNGEFVVVWLGKPTAAPSSTYEQIVGRRVDSNGMRIGDEFEVSVATPVGFGQAPDVTAMDDGAFVVVWRGRSDAQQYRSWVMGQRMDNDATKVGTEFIVNTSEGYVYDPQVDTRGDGSFVVVWAVRGSELTPDPDGAGLGVFGQRFAADGNKAGTEFQVNTFTQYAEGQPDLAVHSDGSFVVVWFTQYGDDEPGAGGTFDHSVTMRRFSSSGIPTGDEEHINTYVTGNQEEPVIAMDDDGSFVVVWRSASGYNAYDNRDDGGGPGPARRGRAALHCSAVRACATLRELT